MPDTSLDVIARLSARTARPIIVVNVVGFNRVKPNDSIVCTCITGNTGINTSVRWHNSMKLYIKNMVCDRCILVINNLLDEMNLSPVSVQLGEVDLGGIELDGEQLLQFQQRVEALGFELINDKKSQLIEAIKTQLITFVQSQEGQEKRKLSDYLSQSLYHDYNYLSHLFSSVEGVTIEQYLIHQKIERAKELLVYDESSLTEIAYQLGYSSVAHLSRQFKKITGMTPSVFKRLRDPGQRQPLDKV